ncbi:hypothetical protein ACYVVI_05645 [Arenicellales bacterium IMCC57338]
MEIKWFLLKIEASKIFFEPVAQNIGVKKSPGIRGPLSCPAVVDRSRRIFSVAAPFDLRFRFTGNMDNPEIRPVYPDTSITFDKLKGVFVLSPKEEWISPDRPVLQLMTPYVFYSEKACYLTQTFPREEIGRGAPFRIIEGRFPIHRWKRPLSWAAEWVDTSRDIVLRRGKPWFDLSFETESPEDSLRLSRVLLSNELEKELLENKDVTSYVRGTFSLMGD